MAVSSQHHFIRFSTECIVDGEQAEERECVMMALVNIGSRLEYGRPTAVLRRIAGIETRTSGVPGMSPTLPTAAAAGRMKVLMAKRLDGDMSKMDITAAARETPLSAAPQEPGLPTALSLAMLSHTLRHPFRRPSEYATPTLNPYNTIILTFLAAVLREPSARAALEHAVPWE